MIIFDYDDFLENSQNIRVIKTKQMKNPCKVKIFNLQNS